MITIHELGLRLKNLTGYKPPIVLKLVNNPHIKKYMGDELPPADLDTWYKTEPGVYENKSFDGFQIVGDDQDYGTWVKSENDVRDISYILDLINAFRGNKHSKSYTIELHTYPVEEGTA